MRRLSLSLLALGLTCAALAQPNAKGASVSPPADACQSWNLVEKIHGEALRAAAGDTAAWNRLVKLHPEWKRLAPLGERTPEASLNQVVSRSLDTLVQAAPVIQATQAALARLQSQLPAQLVAVRTLRSKAGPGHADVIGKLESALQRMASTAAGMSNLDTLKPEDTFALGGDDNLARRLLTSLDRGDAAERVKPMKEPAQREALAAVQSLYERGRGDTERALSNLSAMTNGKDAFLQLRRQVDATQPAMRARCGRP